MTFRLRLDRRTIAALVAEIVFIATVVVAIVVATG
jgi:hypothetical protein